MPRARGTTPNGSRRRRGGYLATLTSAAENAFVAKLLDRPEYWHPFLSGFQDYFWDGPWIGGYQTRRGAEPAGGWKWVTGEPFDYTAWHPAQPDDLFGGQAEQNRLHFWDRRNGRNFANVEPAWDDAASDGGWVSAFVVEYGPESSVPTISIRRKSFRHGWLFLRGRAWSPAGIRAIRVTVNGRPTLQFGAVHWVARKRFTRSRFFRVAAVIIDGRGEKGRTVRVIVGP